MRTEVYPAGATFWVEVADDIAFTVVSEIQCQLDDWIYLQMMPGPHFGLLGQSDWRELLRTFQVLTEGQKMFAQTEHEEVEGRFLRFFGFEEVCDVGGRCHFERR